MRWHGKRVLVTGAGGFIGSHLVERLVDSGAVVRAFVHYNALGTWGWLDESSICREVEVFSGDICDRDSICQAMRDVEFVFHLAALIGIPYSYRAPDSYLRTNIGGTLNVLQCALEGRVERLIHTSTSEVYGSARYVPIDESHPLQGQSPYAATKIGADKMAEAFHLSFGLPVVIVRPFNTFGPRQSARAVVPTIIRQCITGEAVRLGNITPTRDLNYVADTVEGFLLAASVSEATGRTINLGSGREISIGELVSAVGRLTGHSAEIEMEDRRMRPQGSEVERLVADSSLARRMLGWEPKTDLEEGLSRTIEWVRRNPGRSRPGEYAI